MSSDTVLWEQEGPVGLVTLNRPDSLNAWTAEFGAALAEVIEGPAAEPSVRSTSSPVRSPRTVWRRSICLRSSAGSILRISSSRSSSTW